MKHSITKRRTQGRCWEVRLNSMAGPRRVQALLVPLSALVERGLGTAKRKGRPGGRSWLKIGVEPRRNRSVNRRIPPGPMLSAMRTRTAPAASATMSTALFTVQLRSAALRLTEQHPARRGDRRETQGGAGGARGRRPVSDEHERNQYAAERRPAHHVAHPVRRRGLRRGRCLVRHGGRGWCVVVVCGVGPLRGARCGHGSLPVSFGTAVQRRRPAGVTSSAVERGPVECAIRLYGAATIAIRSALVHAPLNAAERTYKQV